MRKVFIIDAKRSAVGNFGGTLKDITAVNLGAEVVKELIKTNQIPVEKIDQTIIGNILTAGQGMGPGRQVSIYAGIPEEKPGYTVNMLCGSGMKSVMIGANDIKLGESDIVIAGGIESMSTSPYLLPYKARFGAKFGNIEILDHMIKDGLTDVFNNYHMGVTAENIAEKYSLSREEQDEFAANSQNKAINAIKDGKFKNEIIPIIIKNRKGDIIFNTDEFPREGITAEKLGKLRPAFKKDGTVTAGNASGINDGASALILASEEAVKEMNLKPIAEIIAYEQAGLDPAYMGLGPVPAIKKLLEKIDVNIEDISLFELNEAFAAQSLGVIKGLTEEFNLDKNWLLERTNVNGGAIALGHPIGASGNRIIVTLLHELQKRNETYGLASLCIGGGMGTAILVKNLK